MVTLRCAVFAREEDLDPIGSAGSYTGYLLIEHPLPWPRDIGDVDELAPLVAALSGTGVRLQGLVPSGRAGRRVVIYRRAPADGFGRFNGSEVVVDTADAVSVAIDLVRGDLSGAPVDGDVLVCTHGTRDTCCGARGTSLIVELGDALPVSRTSHTGGHRFAPTAIVLPQGTLWAYLDADALRRIVARSGSLDDLLPRYRGCAGLDSPLVQTLERVAFADVGWDWLDHTRWGEELGDGRVRLTAESPSGDTSAWEATVDVRRMVPVPDCGLPIEQAKKAEPEYAVRDIERSAAG